MPCESSAATRATAPCRFRVASTINTAGFISVTMASRCGVDAYDPRIDAHSGKPSDHAGAGAADVDQPIPQDGDARDPHGTFDREAGLRKWHAHVFVVFRPEEDFGPPADRKRCADRGDARESANAAEEKCRGREGADRAGDAFRAGSAR